MASHRYTLASPALALQTINHAEQCSVLAREVQYRPGMFDCTGRWHCAYFPAPTNARFYDSARCVREPHAAVSNNSFPLLCTVNGRPHSCASLRYATIVPHPQTLAGGAPVLRATWIAPDWASPQAEDSLDERATLQAYD